MVQDYSDFVARQQADRILNQQSGMARDAFQVLHEIVRPMIDRFKSGRKIPRGGVVGAALPLLAKLQEHPAVVRAQINRITEGRKCTVRESVVIRAVILGSVPDETGRPVLAFFACDMRLTRTSLKVAIHNLDLVVVRHVLVRHGIRERRVTGGFMTGLSRTVELSLPIGLMAAQVGEPMIALPMASGLCLGRLHLVPNEIEPSEMVDAFSYGRRGGIRVASPPPRPREEVISKTRFHMVIRTYCDYDSLTGVRERLLARFADLTARYDSVFGPLFDTFHFGDFIFEVPPGQTRDRLETETQVAINRLYDEVRDLLTSPDWRQFSAQARDGETVRETPVHAVL